MTLPRYLAATRPQSAQVVFEPDVTLTDFVRIHLPLPRRSGIKVRAVDGLSGIAESFPHLALCSEPSTLKGRRFGNVIIAGSAGPLPYQAIAERASRGP